MGRSSDIDVPKDINEKIESILLKSPDEIKEDKKNEETIKSLAEDSRLDDLDKRIKNTIDRLKSKKKYNKDSLVAFLGLLMNAFMNIYTDKSKENAEKIIKEIADEIEDKQTLVKLVLKSLVWEYVDENNYKRLTTELAAFVTDDASLPDFKKPILILGPTGTGKELIARAIHLISKFRKSPFKAINCSAMPETLIESELFGYVAGAHSLAKNDKKGYIEEANDGTIFIDEIGDTSVEIQTKLLRLLNDKNFYKLGDTKEKESKARFVFATNKNLAELIKEKRFKDDFYYRIETFTIKLNSIKEELQNLKEEEKKEEDKKKRFFYEKITWRINKYGFTVKEATKTEICNKLANCEWRGNYRQLYNVLDRAFAIARIINKVTEDLFITKEDIYNESNKASIDVSKMTYQEVEKHCKTLIADKLREILERNEGNKIKCAREAGLIEQDLNNKINNYNSLRTGATRRFDSLCEKFGIDPNEFANKHDKRRKPLIKAIH